MKRIFTKFYFGILICSPFIILNSQTTVIYQHQVEYLRASFTDAGGNFNQNAFQLGQYANGGGAKQAVAWRTLKTAGDNTGLARSLQVGDVIKLSVSATRAFGQLGLSLLASPSSTSSYSDRDNNRAISISNDNFGAWYANYSGNTSTGTNSILGTQGTYKNFEFTCTLITPDRMNIVITDGTTTSNFYDLPLHTSNPITDVALYLSDDWDGANNRNIYWNTNSTAHSDYIQNIGMISIGQSNNTFSVSGVITNGLDANSTTVNSLNNTLTKVGSGTVTLTGANTYSGLTTVSAGTLRFNRAGGGTIPSGNSVTVTGGTLQISSDQTLNNLTLNGGNVTVDDGVTLTINGTLTLTSGKITLGTGNVIVNSAISGGSSSSYIVTIGTGKLTQIPAAGVARLFPVGASNTSYDPVTITPTNSATFDINVKSSFTNAPNNVSKCVSREWDITASGSGATTLAFTPSSSAITVDNTPGTAVFGHYSGSWQENTCTYSAGTWTVSGVTSFSPYGVGVIQGFNTVLGVEIKEIKANAQENKNIIDWVTVLEQNTAQFNIQRSTNNQTWQTIGSVKATNNPTGSKYSFVDEAPLSNISYYRLQMVDNDGKMTYSKVVAVGNDGKQTLSVYPNPTKSELNLVTDGNTEGVSIFDMTGRTVLQVRGQQTKVNVSDLTSGVYFIRLLDNKGVLSTPVRFVKQ